MRRAICTATILLACFEAASGQTSFPGASTAPREPLEIYEPFFHFHNSFQQWLQAAKARTPSASAKLDAAAARYLRVTVSELAGITVVTQDSASRLTAVQTDIGSHLAAAKASGRAPDLVALQTFQQGRQQILEDGIQRLKSSLSPASWNALKAYIEASFGKNLSKLEPGRPPSK